jgi:spore coat protein CotH
MKKFLILLLINAFINSNAQDLYDQNVVHKIEIVFYDNNYKTLLEANYQNEIDIPGQLIFDDYIVLDSVGVRYKGNSSYNAKGDKKSFNVSLDGYTEDQKLLGYKTLNLNNAFVDPTFMRERLGYTIFMNYLPAPKSSHIHLYINGIDYGLYNNVQQINKDFLGEWYSSKKGNSYKGDPQGELSWLGNNPDLYKSKYEKKTNEDIDDWSDLINLIDVINNSTDLENDLPKYLNIDRTLWYFALCNAFVNLDSYIFSSHNYYLYNNPSTGKFDFIPWDVNEIFGTFPPNLPFNKENFAPVNLNAPNRTPLLKKLLANDKFKNIYFSHYKTIMNDFLDKSKIESMINVIRPIIESEVEKDPKKLYTYDNFKTNIYSDVTVENRKVLGILSFIEKRKNFLSQIGELTTNYPVIQNVIPGNNKLIAGSIVPFRASVSGDNIKNVVFHYRFGESSFLEIPMSDDGNHDDISANDKIFGIKLEIPFDITYSNIDYYVTSENQSGRITFFPERAEFVFLSERIEQESNSNAVIINEFMAENKNTIADPQGQYEDWIEFYNNSDTSVSLKNWYLTDDPIEPQKWKFPDTSIAANGYLLTWADKDLYDSGLHVDFKLSKNGEYIGIYNEKSDLIDSYTFGVQSEDVSEGRYPNGSGNFIYMTSPTPRSENKNNSSAIKEQLQKICIFPNPAKNYIEFIFDFMMPESNKLNSSISIWNSYGKCYKVIPINKELTFNKNILIDISHFPIGIYYLKYGNEAFKFVKIN